MISATKDDSYVSPCLESCFLLLKCFLSTCDFHGRVFLRSPLKRELEVTEECWQPPAVTSLGSNTMFIPMPELLQATDYLWLPCDEQSLLYGFPITLTQTFTAIWGSYPTFWPTLSPFIGISSTSFSLYLFLLPFLLHYIDIFPNKSSHI